MLEIVTKILLLQKTKVFFLFAQWGYGKIKNRIRKIEQISDVANFL